MSAIPRTRINEPGGVEFTDLLVELWEILYVEEVKLVFSDDNAVALILNKKILFLINSSKIFVNLWVKIKIWKVNYYSFQMRIKKQ